MPGVPPDALAQVKKGLRGLFSRRKKDRSHAEAGPSEPSTKPTPNSNTIAPTPGTSHHGESVGQTQTGIEGQLPQGLAATEAHTGTPKDTSATSFPPPSSTSTSIPHISEPANAEYAKNVDFNPPTTGTNTSAPASSTISSIGAGTTTTLSTAPATDLAPGTTTAGAAGAGMSSANANNGQDRRGSDLPALDPKPPAAGMSATSGPLEDPAGEGFSGGDGVVHDGKPAVGGVKVKGTETMA